jgi:hypothetical protein
MWRHPRPLRLGRRLRHVVVCGSWGGAGRDPDDPARMGFAQSSSCLARLLDLGLRGDRRLRHLMAHKPRHASAIASLCRFADRSVPRCTHACGGQVMVTTTSSQAHRESGTLEEHQTPGSARNTTLTPPQAQYGATRGTVGCVDTELPVGQCNYARSDKSVSETACLHHAMWADLTETCCKAENRRRLRYGRSANPCRDLQHSNYHT